MVVDPAKMTPIFLGFGAKTVHFASPGQFGAAEKVCSFSNCISGRPTGWDDDPFEAPSLNGAYLASSLDDARQRTPESERSAAAYFAYRAYPVVLGFDGTSLTFDQSPLFENHGPELPGEPDLVGFALLGFDVTEYPSGCSPLSCNGMAFEHHVNRFCLLDDLSDAFQTAEQFARDKPEPGPYIVVEVWGEASFMNRHGE
jgi:hypothetical protein